MASGLGFLGETPIGRFTEDDLRMMRAAIDKALAAPKMGATVRWANDQTSASGEVTPQRAFESQGRPCRDLRIVNRHRRLEASGVYTLCREDGRWTTAP